MVRRPRTARSVVVGLASTLSIAACGRVGAQDLFSTLNAVRGEWFFIYFILFFVLRFSRDRPYSWYNNLDVDFSHKASLSIMKTQSLPEEAARLSLPVLDKCVFFCFFCLTQLGEDDDAASLDSNKFLPAHTLAGECALASARGERK